MDEQEIDQEIDATCRRLGIALADAWRSTVRTHLEAIRAAIALVEDFPLPDETEQAPTFEA